MKTLLLNPTSDNINLCAEEIKKGGIVAFPTETVYGLGADIFNPDAVKKIYEAKGRPSDNPLIVHISNTDDIWDLCKNVPEAAKTLIKLMPASMTLIFRKKDIVPDCITAGMDTVGIRMPAHDVALKFIDACGVPICAPSANKSSSPSPTEAAHVWDDLNGKIKYILDGGRCKVGIESTIIDFSNDRPRILRKGGVPIEILKDYIGDVDIFEGTDKALCPGMKYKHYSPKAHVFYCKKRDNMVEVIKDFYGSLKGKKQIFCLSENLRLYEGYDVRDMGKDDESYAYQIFAAFREADKQGYDFLILEGVDDKGIGAALINRAIKASGGNLL